MKPSDVELEEAPQHLVDILSRAMALLPLLLFVCFLLLLLCNHSTGSCHLGLRWSAPHCLRKQPKGRLWSAHEIVDKCMLRSNQLWESVCSSVCLHCRVSVTVAVIVEGYFHAPLIHCHHFHPWQRNRIMSDKLLRWSTSAASSEHVVKWRVCSHITSIEMSLIPLRAGTTC